MDPTAILTTAAASPPLPVEFDWWFPLYFAALWVAASTLLAFFSGHMKLLARFPPVDEPEEETFRFASGQMRSVSYSSALRVAIGARGLHIAASALFRPLSHRGIPCIPWGEIRLVRSQSQGLVARFMGSKFEVPALDLRFTVGGAAGRAVERKLASLTPSDRGSMRTLVREA